jgi:hypothetical protein
MGYSGFSPNRKSGDAEFDERSSGIEANGVMHAFNSGERGSLTVEAALRAELYQRSMRAEGEAFVIRSEAKLGLEYCVERPTFFVFTPNTLVVKTAATVGYDDRYGEGTYLRYDGVAFLRHSVSNVLRYSSMFVVSGVTDDAPEDQRPSTDGVGAFCGLGPDGICGTIVVRNRHVVEVPVTRFIGEDFAHRFFGIQLLEQIGVSGFVEWGAGIDDALNDRSGMGISAGGGIRANFGRLVFRAEVEHSVHFDRDLSGTAFILGLESQF